MERLLPIVGFLIALGLFFGYINPTMTGPIAATRAEIAGYDAALAAAEQFKQKQAALEAERAAIPPESIVRLESFLPDGVDNVQLILDLDSLASHTGITLSNFDTSELEKEEAQSADGIVIPNGTPLDSIELKTTGKGTYAAFRTFLDATEESLRPLDLVSLDIKTSQNGVHSYDMVFRLYWLR